MFENYINQHLEDAFTALTDQAEELYTNIDLATATLSTSLAGNKIIATSSALNLPFMQYFSNKINNFYFNNTSNLMAITVPALNANTAFIPYVSATYAQFCLEASSGDCLILICSNKDELEDLRSVIDEAHNRNIEVILLANIQDIETINEIVDPLDITLLLKAKSGDIFIEIVLCILNIIIDRLNKDDLIESLSIE